MRSRTWRERKERNRLARLVRRAQREALAASRASDPLFWAVHDAQDERRKALILGVGLAEANSAGQTAVAAAMADPAAQEWAKSWAAVFAD